MRDEAFFCCGVSREIPSSFLSLARVLDTTDATQEALIPLMQLKKFHDIPISTREKHRGSHHNSRGGPFSPPQLEMRVPFPASLGRDFWRSCHISRGGALKRKVERNSRGPATIPKDPQMSHPLHMNLIYLHCIDCHPRYRLTPWWHV